MREEKAALSGATGNAGKHDPFCKGQNRNNHFSTQLRLPGEWPADYDAHRFSEDEIRRAQATWEDYQRLSERVPDVVERATAITFGELRRVGFCGTRLMGERVRSWCLAEYGATFGNNVIGALARTVVAEHPELEDSLRLHFCALDVVPHE